MFYITSLSGSSNTYVPGRIRSNRLVKPTQGVSAILPKQLDQHVSSGALEIKDKNPYKQLNIEEPRREVNYAQDIMSTPVVSVSSRSAMREVNRIFTDKRFRHLPVVADDGNLVGIISDRQVLKYNSLHIVRKTDHESEPVTSVMVCEVLTATPDTLIRDIARIMFEERIGSVPIVNSKLALLGMITRSDILRTIITNGPIQLWI